MNWTGGKRNKIKVKSELQKQKEFFNRQRLKKVHSFLSIEQRLAHTLSSIEVVCRSETTNLSDMNEPSDIEFHQHTEIDNDNIIRDITKRKQFLLQVNDWAGVGCSSTVVQDSR
ncbi:2510_t:CDS:2 [Funneliformis geosporum]|uniref:13453_t:CDS:1 n=1 Tax=Funneliformis geosporum TaxID=1117311 RepID=A0A9W4SFL0_9GLOM|nr:2510_t:CDS:2 [Funneliformis geosporum]CAI2166713.1 13453_t:CDS:2 [Funneliformis geosporum]